jgi:hypothetical protein
MIWGVIHLKGKDTYYTKQNTVRNMFIAKSTYSPYVSIHVSTYFHQYTVNKQEKLQIHLYTVLIQRINVIFTDQLPIFHVLKIGHTVLNSKCTKFTIPAQKYHE